MKSFLLTVLIIAYYAGSGYSQSWEWVTDLNIPGLSNSSRVSFEKADHPDQFYLAAEGFSNSVIRKYNRQGSILWEKALRRVQVKNICTSDLGELFVCGSIDSTVNFGFGSEVCTGPTEAFVAKISGNGNFEWVETFGSINSDLIYDLAYSNGAIYLTGTFDDSGFSGSRKLFFGKLNSTGTLVFQNLYDRYDTSYSGGGSGRAIQVKDGHVYLLASCLNLQLETASYPSGYSPELMAKFDTSGSYLWSKQIHDGLDHFHDFWLSNANINLWGNGSYTQNAWAIASDLNLSGDMIWEKTYEINSYGSDINFGAVGIENGTSYLIFNVDTLDTGNWSSKCWMQVGLFNDTGLFIPQISARGYGNNYTGMQGTALLTMPDAFFLTVNVIDSARFGTITVSGDKSVLAKISREPLKASEFHKSEVTIYPNPSSGTFSISGLEGRRFESALIHDLSGRLIKSFSQVEVSTFSCELNPGWYYLVLINSDFQISKEFVILD